MDMPRELVLLVLLFIAGFPAKGQQGSEIEFYMSSADENMKNYNFEEAIQLYNRAIREQSNLVEAYKGRALAKNQLGEYNEALDDIEKALNLKDDDPEIFIISGEIRTSKKDYGGALVNFNTALTMEPNSKQALAGKAMVLYFMENKKEAMNIIEKGVFKFPNEEIYHYHQGLLFMFESKYKKALNAFDKVLRLNPSYRPFDVYLNRGIANYQQLENENAIADLTKAIQLNEDNASAYHSRGRIYYEMEEYQEAIEDFKKSLSLNPNSEVTHYNLGMAYYKNENMSDACENFHKSCSLGNKNACKMVIMECADLID
jgi:tetratricopeptide (TPR) repeat protein